MEKGNPADSSSVPWSIYQCTVTVFLLHNIEITVNPCESMWILHLHRTPSDTIGLCFLQNPDFVECTYAIICWRWTYQCQLKIGTLPVACWCFRLGDETTWNNSLKSPLQAYGVKGKPSSRCTQDQWLSLGAFLQGISQFSSVILIPRRL